MTTTRTRWMAALLAAALVLLAASCGDDDGGSASSDDSEQSDEVSTPEATSSEEPDGEDLASGERPDPCGLITAQDIESATGVAFPEGEFNEQLSNDFQSICDWVSESPFATAQVLVNDSGMTFEDQRSSVEDAFGEETVDVDLSVPAYRTAEGSIVAMVVDDLFVQVSYIPADASVDPTDATVQMAETVLANLG